MSNLFQLTNSGNRYLLPSDLGLAFVDNHDNQRGHGAGGDSILTYKNGELYKMAVAFTLATDYGVTRVMSSYDFNNSDQGPPQDDRQNIISPKIDENGQCINGWICEHRWQVVKNMIKFKNLAKNAPVSDFNAYSDDQISFRRGDGFIVFNRAETEFNLENAQVFLPKGTYCDIYGGSLNKGSCTGMKIEVDANMMASIKVPAKSAVAFHKMSKIK